VNCDVRQAISAALFGDAAQISMLVNFAAVHREPGHPANEYFETNIPGAINVCAFAEAIGCNDILFTSSISPYGPSETPRAETDIPTPETAYGSSKFAAELIHEAWRCRGVAERRLLIVRPGVVFGPGEGGNVSRLVSALTKGFFVYAGNRQTRKAGIYVKELCNAMWWMHELQAKRAPALATANMTMNPGPSMQDYVDTVQEVAQKKAFVPSVPVWSLMLAARVIQTILGPFGIFKSVNVVRVRKIIRSNNIIPGVLAAEGYPYKFTLKSALEDWRNDMPSEWRINQT
jgi:nucleoside-diphosphate-sugar epimerase